MLYEIIGKAAMLEQTVEEAAELAQACLKLARYERMKNGCFPMPKQLESDLVEEMVNVIICIDELKAADSSLNSWMRCKAWEKKKRMQERLKEIDERRRATDEQIDT